jgi:hypothetical protein
MIATEYRLTDEGNRALLRELSHELTSTAVADLVSRFAEGLRAERHGEFEIDIKGSDIDCCTTKVFSLPIESHHVDRIIVNEEDYE